MKALLEVDGAAALAEGNGGDFDGGGRGLCDGRVRRWEVASVCVMRSVFSVQLRLRIEGMARREGTWWRGIVGGSGGIGTSGT